MIIVCLIIIIIITTITIIIIIIIIITIINIITIRQGPRRPAETRSPHENRAEKRRNPY